MSGEGAHRDSLRCAGGGGTSPCAGRGDSGLCTGSATSGNATAPAARWWWRRTGFSQVHTPGRCWRWRRRCLAGSGVRAVTQSGHRGPGGQTSAAAQTTRPQQATYRPALPGVIVDSATRCSRPSRALTTGTAIDRHARRPSPAPVTPATSGLRTAQRRHTAALAPPRPPPTERRQALPRCLSCVVTLRLRLATPERCCEKLRQVPAG